MQLNFLLDEPNSPSLCLQRSAWTGKTKLYADGQEVPLQSKPGLFSQIRSFMVPMADGSERQLTLKIRFYDPVPEAHVDGEPILLAKALTPWEYVVACIPMLLIFGGGLLGGIFGVAAMVANISMMRSERPAGLRIAFCAGITLMAFVGYVLVVGMLQLAVES
jgi:hypothetical protein